MQTVLAKIVADKAIWVEARKQQQPLASFQNEIVPTQRNFYDALTADLERRSRERGILLGEFPPNPLS